ncbi:putative lipase ROG1 [Senna tora]|uniref:Putative lipase ROG1 n=1 Tax=Senna tora TaxID=362788 RepID=A0A834WQM1_9FABA|nr:putative lipase ROG1 [Senna tora]
MASMDAERLTEVEEGGGSKKEELNETKNDGNKKKSRNSTRVSFLPKFRCFRIQDERDATGESFDMEVVDASGHRSTPTHLIIMVNGLIGSAENWKFAAKQFLKRYPHDVIVHCSECNSSMLTFDGVEVMGKRLAEEVISVIKRHQGVQKISFVGHSLGGLVARYAVAKLYGRDISREYVKGNEHSLSHNLGQESHEKTWEGKIAGLEPINFITSATPHLGCRGHKQHQHLSRHEKYPHIVNVEIAKSTLVSEEVLDETSVNGSDKFDLEDGNDDEETVKLEEKQRKVHMMCQVSTENYIKGKRGRAISSLIEGTKKKGMKVQGVVISAKAQIGSRPPKCERRCTSCGHCEAVQVPIVPQFQSHRSHSAARKPSSSGTPSVTYSSRSDDLSNYKPMSWKCKCGNYFFNP